MAVFRGKTGLRPNIRYIIGRWRGAANGDYLARNSSLAARPYTRRSCRPFMQTGTPYRAMKFAPARLGRRAGANGIRQSENPNRTPAAGADGRTRWGRLRQWASCRLGRKRGRRKGPAGTAGRAVKWAVLAEGSAATAVVRAPVSSPCSHCVAHRFCDIPYGDHPPTEMPPNWVDMVSGRGILSGAGTCRHRTARKNERG